MNYISITIYLIQMKTKLKFNLGYSIIPPPPLSRVVSHTKARLDTVLKNVMHLCTAALYTGLVMVPVIVSALEFSVPTVV
jgi:hypothetical protein